ncbi:MAG: ThuA domain-containing protein [Planctomycetia bacterium]|nr:ThuA domain-containing protein [Planctomycetia bacterium]
MKKFCPKRCCLAACMILTFFLLCTSFISALSAQENGEKIRVLFISGGHPFNEEELDAFMNSFPELEITKAVMPAARDLLKPGLESSCDVVLFYDMDNSPVSEEQKSNYVALLNSGIGVFAWHHHLCSNQNWEEYYDLAGGRTFLAPTADYRGKEYPASVFACCQPIKLHVEKPDHPVTKGISDFTITDEIYGKLLIHPDAEVLLTSDHELQNHITAWIWHYGKSTIVANLLGHDSVAWNQPEFKQMFIQTLRFLADEKAKTTESR